MLALHVELVHGTEVVVLHVGSGRHAVHVHEVANLGTPQDVLAPAVAVPVAQLVLRRQTKHVLVVTQCER